MAIRPGAAQMSYWTGGEEGYSFYESVAPYEAPPDPTIFERISDAIADMPKRPIALALLAAGGTAAVAWSQHPRPPHPQSPAPDAPSSLLP